jgi:anti-sigma regulatory factor (Ser/Thr protein kinase)
LAEGQCVRGIGEPVHCDRSDAEMTECHHHEALLNLAFADAPGFQLMCPYDTDVLPRDAVDGSLMTHPLVQQDGDVRESALYRGEQMAQETFEEPLDPPPESAYEMTFDRDSLGALRAFVSELAADAGIDGERREDLLLAISELATNSVRHGGGNGELRAWLDSGALVCEVTDRGVIARPLTGRRRPTAGALGGYGLWLVNQVCDLVQVRTRFGRTVVRMRMRRG